MATFYKLILLIAVCGNCAVQSATHRYRPLRYTIPQPLIRAFSPQGLQGNINKPLHWSETQMLDEKRTEKDGERWAYENPTVKLHVGDKIYYTLFVVKDNLGYMLQERVQEINELVSLDDDGLFPSNTPLPPVAGFPPSSTTPPPALACPPTAAACTICKNVVWNITQELFDLQQENDSQREMNDILKDLVQKHPQTSKNLVLDGVNSKDDELVVIVQAIINEKLHLNVKVHKVRRTKEGMVRFEVDNVEEKVAVIAAAKRELKASKFKIMY